MCPRRRKGCKGSAAATIAQQSQRPMRKLILFFFFWRLQPHSAPLSAQQYDLVLEGGRVMDPETGLDAVRNVGIRDGKIARISTEALSGRRRSCHRAGRRSRIHRSAPARSGPGQPARQGARRSHHGSELEIGAPDVAQFLKAKEGRSLIHYGTSASHVAARALVFGAPLPEGDILPKSGPATDQPATPEQIEVMRELACAETRRWRLGHRHGHPVHAGSDPAGSD